MRLNRYLSQCGLGSRRGCEQLILEGRVSINGHILRDLSTQVGPDDRVVADGKPVKAEAGVVIALHKPRGYICSRSDEKDRMTIYSLLPKPYQSLHHVGRLDKDSEGLLLMTNRGELSHRLIHPSMGAEKEYEVIVDQPMDQATMAKLVKGMLTEEGHAKCERAWMITEYKAHVVLKQGLKRQIRLMFYQLGFEVERLTRTRIGWLELKGLQKGAWKQLTQVEVERFFSKDGATGRPSKSERSGVVARSSDEDDGESPRSSRPAARKPRAGRPGTKTAGKAERPQRSRSRSFDNDAPERPARRERDERPRTRSSEGEDRPRSARSRSTDREDSPRGPRSRSRSSGADRSSEREDRPRGGPRSRSSSRDEESPRSRGGKRPAPTRTSRTGGSHRSEEKPKSYRSGGPSRPQRASVKRSRKK